ncbi:MAG TPA: PilZ domain-containing protein [Thermodesulfobacteriota bacterium]|nr:PilZ domain-containing protein [Thermodesulfobacteriota bacterium]
MESISGNQATNLLNTLIDSRRLLKLRIPETPFCWITLLSGIEKQGHSRLLRVDAVPGFQNAFANSRRSGVALEYQDPGGILCFFEGRVAKISPQMIWIDCPEFIYRVQRRKFYRLEAASGTEVSFAVGEMRGRGAVKDYSLGGLAFRSLKSFPLFVNTEVRDLCLKIPEAGDWLSIPIALAVLRRADVQRESGAFIYGLEYMQIAEGSLERLSRHIFEKQRTLLRKLGKNFS